MSDFPCELIIEDTFGHKQTESLMCKALLRYVPKKRKIYDADWNDREVVAKVFLNKFSAKRHLLREWKNQLKLHKSELYTVEPLFYGRTRNGQWVIVEEKIPDSSNGRDLFFKCENYQQKQELLNKLCRVLAEQHIHGILQKDLHPGNFLLQGEKVFLLDAAQMRFENDEIGRIKSISQLVLMAGWLPDSRIECIKKICREYFDVRGWNFGRSDYDLFLKKLALQRKRAIRKKLKKYLRTNRRHIRIRDKKYTAEFNRNFCSRDQMNDFIARVDNLMEQGDIIKDGRTCFVSRLSWGGRDVVVKRYNHIGFIHSLRHSIKKSRSCRCWLHGHRLELLDIRTPQTLAYIERRKAMLVLESYLVTEFVKGVKLNIYLQDNSIDKEKRSAIIRDVVEMLNHLWSSRITHGDLKNTNTLVTENGPVLTDLDGMVAHKYKLLFKKKKAKDIERFLQNKELLSISPDITQTLTSQNEELHKTISACFENMKIDDWMISAKRNLSKEDIINLLSVSNADIENTKNFSKIPSSDYTCVHKTDVHSDDVDVTVYIKHYLNRSSIDFIKHLFRPSRARRAFNASLMLQENGFNAPEVLCLAEKRSSLFNLDNVLVTKEIKNARALPEVIKKISQNRDRNSVSQKRSLIEAFAITVGKLHSKGIFHGDLRLNNVLVVEQGGNWQFYFIDNERTKKYGCLPVRKRLKNLVQINMFLYDVSNADRLRFFKFYLRENPDIQAESSRWIKNIVAKTESRLRRKHWSEVQRIRGKSLS